MNVAHPNTIRGPIEEQYNALREGIEAQYVEDRQALEATRNAALAANQANKSAALAAAGLNADGSVPSTYPETADPENTVAPTISGNAHVGDTLTANDGTWTFAPTFTYQWERADADRSNVTPIQGATSKTYVLTTNDAGKLICVRVTGSNSVGEHTVQSDFTATAVLAVPSNTALPTISGTEQVGQVLTAVAGTWDGEDTVVNQWERADNDQGLNAADIPGEQTLTYTLVLADLGKYLRLIETATNAAGQTTVESAYHGPIAAA